MASLFSHDGPTARVICTPKRQDDCVTAETTESISNKYLLNDENDTDTRRGLRSGDEVCYWRFPYY